MTHPRPHTREAAELERCTSGSTSSHPLNSHCTLAAAADRNLPRCPAPCVPRSMLFILPVCLLFIFLESTPSSNATSSRKSYWVAFLSEPHHACVSTSLTLTEVTC